MKKNMICLILALMNFTIHFAQNDKNLILWYDKPADKWEEALPLGNGVTGAMVFGGTNNELYQLNDHSLWSGFPISGNNSNGQTYLKPLREAVFEGDYEQAAEYWKKMQGPYSARYLPLGNLSLQFELGNNKISSYKRQLDLNDAVSMVTYKSEGVLYKRESFISYPDKVMVIKLTANQKHKISFKASLSSQLKYHLKKTSNNYLILRGKAPKYVAHRASEPKQITYSDSLSGEGMNFEIHIKLRAFGGKYISNEKGIEIKEADSVVLYLTEATSFNGFNKSPGLEGKNPGHIASTIMTDASSKSYAELKKSHLDDYQNLFKRVGLNLGNSTKGLSCPTNERLQRFNKGGKDNGLIALYYQYGRYLLISSSRTGAIPANLQGIWNPHVQPPWGSNYTININTEMNYWPAENTNLSECSMPLFDFIKNLAINGAETASVNYGIKSGWVAHHNSDIWAKSSPAGGYEWDPKSAARWSAWPMAGAWLVTHLWEHYLYTGDKKFLKEDAYPLMKGACEFMLAWLVEDGDGYLVTNPSTSPEHEFVINGKGYEISMASTMDMSIIRDLFMASINASMVLDIDKEFQTRLQLAKNRLYPYHIGKYGQLQEWFKDWDNPSDHHRHLSHLFGLFPDNQITVSATPELAAAAKRSLLQRGDESTGWSMAWKINWWARLNEGNHAYKILKDGLNYIDPSLNEGQMSGGGTYPNLFDAHPPFQIDGNLGGTAGITEMLIQSHGGEISLLPALPDEWPKGELSGVKTRGNFTVDMVWDNSTLKEAHIYSNIGGNCRIRSKIPLKVLEVEYKEARGKNANPLMNIPDVPPLINNTKASLSQIVPNGEYLIDFSTEKGKEYTLVPLK